MTDQPIDIDDIESRLTVACRPDIGDDDNMGAAWARIAELEAALKPFAEVCEPNGDAWAFVKRGRVPAQAFENAARVLRGGTE